jgi:hypothetical protein
MGKMDRYNDHISRKRNQIELAEKIKANVKKTKSFSDSELRINNNDWSLEADPVYNMLKLLEEYNGFLHINVSYEGMKSISIESLVSRHPFNIKRDIEDLKKRKMEESLYNRLNNPNFCTFLRQEFQKWIEEKDILKYQTPNIIPMFVQKYDSAFGVEHESLLASA